MIKRIQINLVFEPKENILKRIISRKCVFNNIYLKRLDFHNREMTQIFLYRINLKINLINTVNYSSTGISIYIYHKCQ